MRYELLYSKRFFSFFCLRCFTLLLRVASQMSGRIHLNWACALWGVMERSQKPRARYSIFSLLSF